MLYEKGCLYYPLISFRIYLHHSKVSPKLLHASVYWNGYLFVLRFSRSKFLVGINNVCVFGWSLAACIVPSELLFPNSIFTHAICMSQLTDSIFHCFRFLSYIYYHHPFHDRVRSLGHCAAEYLANSIHMS